jgi:hypothetical protein
MNKMPERQQSCDAVSFFKAVVGKKQDLLSAQSCAEDAVILKNVRLLEKKMKEGNLLLPMNECVSAFGKLNDMYVERNVSCTGIGALGCFLIEYILTQQDLYKGAKMLYNGVEKKDGASLRQNEWYNHALGRIFDLAAQKKELIARKNISSSKISKERTNA